MAAGRLTCEPVWLSKLHFPQEPTAEIKNANQGLQLKVYATLFCLIVASNKWYNIRNLIIAPFQLQGLEQKGSNAQCEGLSAKVNEKIKQNVKALSYL